jgi:protein prenyltransferase alpha subunit repeat containing protein 1
MVTTFRDSDTLETIITEAVTIFQMRDIVEVDFIPSAVPPYVVTKEQALGLSTSVLKPLYAHAYKYLCHWYTIIKDLVFNKQGLKEEVLNQLDRYSLMVLMIKGDLAFAYTVRKTLLLEDKTKISKEIGICAAIFAKHPKSPSGWEHRRWCYRQRATTKTALAPAEIETERELCKIMAEKYPKNYYAWRHRLWLLSHMTKFQVNTLLLCAFIDSLMITYRIDR